MKLQVLFCSKEVGRTSFVRQLEPDWHIDSNREISSQLAVCLYLYLCLYIFCYKKQIKSTIQNTMF